MVQVVFELVLPLKGGGAVGAAEGTRVRVDHHVLRQRLLDAEGLVALRTPVGFLTWRESGGIALAGLSHRAVAARFPHRSGSGSASPGWTSL